MDTTELKSLKRYASEVIGRWFRVEGLSIEFQVLSIAGNRVVVASRAGHRSTEDWRQFKQWLRTGVVLEVVGGAYEARGCVGRI